jgi:hypothetical protein
MKNKGFKIAIGLVLLVVAAAVVTLIFSRTAREAVELVSEDGEKILRDPMRPIRGGTRVLLFALDGVGDDKLREMIATGRMPTLARLAGEQIGADEYAHAYAVPGALSILPSTTMAAWASVFTGQPVSQTGIPGNEWYTREELKYYAPGPVSVEETEHTIASYTDGFLGNAIRVPTLFELADVRSHVSLMTIHRGADLLTVPRLSHIARAFGATAAGAAGDEDVDRGTYRVMDEGATDELLASFYRHGIPDLQVVYFPGIDLYTHVADDPGHDMEEYLTEVTDPAIARIIDAYAEAGVLDRTFIVFVSDHGHTPVIKDERYALGSDNETGPPGVLELAGFRMRPMSVDPGGDDHSYQAAVAYQGAMAYIYLANRATCPNMDEPCSWMLSPRYEEDVLVAARAFDRANRFGEGVPALQGTLDLILVREPRPVGEDAAPFEVFDGTGTIPLATYLSANPRPEFPQFEERMRDLAEGPYGHRAGDILLLAHAGMHLPIEQRFYFSRVYSSWHGSPEWEDSRIPIFVIHPSRSGSEIQAAVEPALSDTPSQLDITPLVLRLLDMR